MIEAFNLDLLDDLRRRQPTLHRSEGKRVRRRVGETLIAVGRWLDPELASTRRRARSDCVWGFDWDRWMGRWECEAMDRRTRSSLIFAILLVAAVGVVLLAQAAVRGRAPAAAPPDAAGDAAMVIGVSDGDTIRVRLDSGRVERVRYIGIDAPELAHPVDGIAAECFGDEATDANRRLVDGLAVILERDVSDRDRHGRLLRHVWIAGDGGSQLVALLLVSDGAADAHAYPPDIRWDRELAAAEATARNAAAGMWGACPGG